MFQVFLGIFLSLSSQAYAYDFGLSSVEKWANGRTYYVVRDEQGKFMDRGTFRLERWKFKDGSLRGVAVVRTADGKFLTPPQEGIVSRYDQYYVSKGKDCVRQMAVVRGLSGKFISAIRLNDTPICW